MQWHPIRTSNIMFRAPPKRGCWFARLPNAPKGSKPFRTKTLDVEAKDETRSDRYWPEKQHAWGNLACLLVCWKPWTPATPEFQRFASLRCSRSCSDCSSSSSPSCTGQNFCRLVSNQLNIRPLVTNLNLQITAAIKSRRVSLPMRLTRWGL